MTNKRERREREQGKKISANMHYKKKKHITKIGTEEVVENKREKREWRKTGVQEGVQENRSAGGSGGKQECRRRRKKEEKTGVVTK